MGTVSESLRQQFPPLIYVNLPVELKRERYLTQIKKIILRREENLESWSPGIEHSPGKVCLIDITKYGSECKACWVKHCQMLLLTNTKHFKALKTQDYKLYNIQCNMPCASYGKK